MNRNHIGVVLLAALLAAGLWTERFMTDIHGPAAAALEASAAQAAAGEWIAALESRDRARESWRSSWSINAALADHAFMEEIDSLFARLTVYAGQRDTGEYAAACRELSRRLQAMADAHTLAWYNVL